MTQTIKLKRGLESNRTSITPVAGELVYTTDNLEIFFGNGALAGGSEIGYLNTRTGGQVNGKTSINSAVTIAAGSDSVNVFEVLDSAGAGLFEVTESGNAIIGGKLTVNGTGQSSFAGDVLIGGSLTVNGDATVAVDLAADTLVITGDLNVNGNTYLGNEATDTISLTGGVITDILPSTDNTYDLGSAAQSWAELWAGNIESTLAKTSITGTVGKAAGTGEVLFEVVDVNDVNLLSVKDNGDVTVAGTLTVNGTQSAFDGDVTVTGNLTVNGTTTTVNSNEVNIGDSIILLNSNEILAPTQNGGIEIERGTDDNVSIFWNEAADAWYITKDTNDVVSNVRILDTDDLADLQNALGTTNLGDLADVTLTTISESDMIMWSGSEWVNSSTIDGGTF
jgi:formylmethanofuran dehydrogenase subunit C